MESKRAGIAFKDMTMQCWKNIRLDRCLQEAHRTIGLSNPSIVMADIAGSVRVVYHIVPFEDIWTVERTTVDFVHLPMTEGGPDRLFE
ncbi:hypothetical protein BGZ88_001799 [Linnemannia elongata]|nr:hypothetical protein BGZ88_001799 [Linnemannia elongata]